MISKFFVEMECGTLQIVIIWFEKYKYMNNKYKKRRTNSRIS